MAGNIRSIDDVPRPNFIDLFEKKGVGEKWVGDSGYICTYSADKEVLERVVETFNNGAKTRNVIHLILGNGCKKLFGHIRTLGLDHEKVLKRTLHAKVCLLKFKRKNSKEICYRVIVTTGNLSKNSLKNDWDLYWYNDLVINTDCLGSKKFAQERANIWAAKEFFEKLLEYYPENSGGNSNIYSKIDFDFKEFVKELENTPKGKNPQFIHSIEKPLIEQITSKAQKLRGKEESTSYPYLIVGSGFYGEKKNEENIPDSLIQTVQKFQTDVFSKNKLKCCYVAYSHMLKDAVGAEVVSHQLVKRTSSSIDFRLCPVAKDETNKINKNLHAKFIFGSFKGPSKPENRTFFKRNFLYLGSGNISSEGLFQKGTNIEAGVFIDLSQQTFSFANTCEKPKYQKIEKFLPINVFEDWKNTIDSAVDAIKEVDKGKYFACPILYLKLTRDKKLQVLHTDVDDGFDFQFYWPINCRWNPKDGDFLDIKNITEEELRGLVDVFLTWNWKGEDGVIRTQTEPILIINEKGELRANHVVRGFDPKDPFACTIKIDKDEKKDTGRGEEDSNDDSERNEEEQDDYQDVRVKDTDLRIAMMNFASLFRAFLWKIKNENEDWDVWLVRCNDIVDQNKKKFEALKKYRVNPFRLLLSSELLEDIEEEGAREGIKTFVKDIERILGISGFDFIGSEKKRR